MSFRTPLRIWQLKEAPSPFPPTKRMLLRPVRERLTPGKYLTVFSLLGDRVLSGHYLPPPPKHKRGSFVYHLSMRPLSADRRFLLFGDKSRTGSCYPRGPAQNFIFQPKTSMLFPSSNGFFRSDTQNPLSQRSPRSPSVAFLIPTP